MLHLVNVIWGARCGKTARRVLLGETRSRDHAYSVRRRRESALTRQAPHGLPSSRRVSTIRFDRRLHGRMREVGAWLHKVLLGFYNYHAVPGNLRRLWSMRYRLLHAWWRILGR